MFHLAAAMLQVAQGEVSTIMLTGFSRKKLLDRPIIDAYKAVVKDVSRKAGLVEGRSWLKASFVRPKATRRSTHTRVKC